MKKINVLVLFLLFVPFVWAGDIEGLHEQLKNNVVALNEWEVHDFTAEEVKQFREELGVKELELTRIEAFSSTDQNVIDLLLKEINAKTIQAPYRLIYEKEAKDILKMYIVGYEKEGLWTRGYWVIFDDHNKTASYMRVEGKITQDEYNKVVPQLLAEMEQLFSLFSLMP